MKLPGHKTKIICTIGPASRSAEVLTRLMKSGMSIARLNLAHGDLEQHREDIRRIRSIASELNHPVSIMLDLPGPKIRIGKLENEPLFLTQGSDVVLTTRNVIGTIALLPVEFEELPHAVSKGGIIFLNDGFLQLKVLDISGQDVSCKVLVGGQLFSHKGLNLPRARVIPDPLTEKDLEFVTFGLEEGVDIFGMSFVERAKDIVQVKSFAREKGKYIYVVAKIEREEAVKNIDGIMEVADAIMVARGDLGVQISIQDVPMVQKKLIRKANLRGRPVITATQMLESMVENVRPTRAEATDVANAILDGTDAVMLSEETAMGKYPVETVKMMAQIAISVERQRSAITFSSPVEDYFRNTHGRKNITIEDVVSLNVIDALHGLNIRFVLTPTFTGSTPRRISRFKPNCWILAFSSNEPTCRFANFSYGVYPILMEDAQGRWHDSMIEFIRYSGLAKKGDTVVLTEGSSLGQFGSADSLRIAKVD
ncbi:MAG: pyruvate kinase [Dehalococcoidia bacterium]|nr:pyruvate kinase [Dehalococcoidia bacterium]